MSPHHRRLALRVALTSGECHTCPSVFDPVSARFAQDLGFDATILGGSVVSLMTAGAPDVNVLTLTELAEQVRRISLSADIPLIVDADDGYGNALNVMRATRELEMAGAAAVSIEDTLLPRPYAGRGPVLIPVGEAADRILAATVARQDQAMAVIARTQIGPVPFEQTIQRVRAYADVHADMICVTGTSDLSQVAAIAKTAELPILFITYADNPPLSNAALHEAGVRLRLDGHFAHRAAIRAIHQTLAHLRAGDILAAARLAAPGTLMAAASRLPDYEAAAAQFLAVRI